MSKTQNKPKSSGKPHICSIVCANEKGEEATFEDRASCANTNYPNKVGEDCSIINTTCVENQVITNKCKNMYTENIRDTAQCNEDEYLINTCETPGYLRPKTAGGKYKNKTTKKQMKKSKSKRTKHMKKSKKNTRK